MSIWKLSVAKTKRNRCLRRPAGADNRKRIGLAICAAWFAIGISSNKAFAQALDLSGYELTFNEEFKTLDISAHGPHTRWTAHTPWHGDFGDAVFDNPGPDGPFELTPDGLRIVARKDADGKWRSGLICSVDRDGPGQNGFSQKFGYFEMKAKLPDGPGVWAAFWLIGVNKESSAAEIDVLEYYGAFPEYYHNVAHVFKDGVDRLSRDNLVKVPSGSLTSRFNTYGVLIEPDKTTYYLNRNPVGQLDTPPEFKQPMYILANFALGGGWPIKIASGLGMDIAYIKVYQSKEASSGK
jgi:beta-glucanase (GH16 family)